MQNDSLDGELQPMLNELCTDLFATSALGDCKAILQSLALLAETYPQAQSLVGRLLSRNEADKDRTLYVPVSKLFVLATKFLYKKETARATVSLLAALASGNARNQRRIVCNVTGIKLDIDPNKHNRTQTLYALTVPAFVTKTYRRWRKRQRELQYCRLPSGVPPVQEGIPMPCHCDDCLGAEQFLSTWHQHFRDLSRWSADPDKEASTSRPFPSLSTEEFFRVFLADHQLHACSVVEALGSQKEAEGVYAARASRHQSLVYYFVSPDEVTAATLKTQVPFDPFKHLSAIEIATEVGSAAMRKAQSRPSHSLSLPSDFEGSSTLAPEQVILFTSICDVKSCGVAFAESIANHGVIASSNERLVADFCRLEKQHGQLVQCDYLVNKVNEESSELADTTRLLLLCMLAFCDSGDQIPLSVFRRNFDALDVPRVATPHQVEQTKSTSHRGNIVMTAKLSERVLQIDCLLTASEKSLSSPFSTCVPQNELLGMNNTDEDGNLDLLYLCDDALQSLLLRCRICTRDTCNHASQEDADSAIYLQPIASNVDEQVVTAHTSDKAVSNLASKRNLQNASSLPLPGLSSKATQSLMTLISSVSEERWQHYPTYECLASLARKLAKVAANCNERISHLSTARDKEFVRATTEIQRAAAISRCRHCRDLLLKLGKRLALEVKSLDLTAPTSQDKLLHVAKLVRSSIHNVLIRSKSFDPWETPDVRVEKLHLDRRIWASGFPDVAYYQDIDVRLRENRKEQQQLSRKLLLQHRKKRDEARAK